MREQICDLLVPIYWCELSSCVSHLMPFRRIGKEWRCSSANNHPLSDTPSSSHRIAELSVYPFFSVGDHCLVWGGGTDYGTTNDDRIREPTQLDIGTCI